MIYGTKLRDYRKPRKVSQAELAAALGYADRSSVCRMERGLLTEDEYAKAVDAVDRIFAAAYASLHPATDGPQ